MLTLLWHTSVSRKACSWTTVKKRIWTVFSQIALPVPWSEHGPYLSCNRNLQRYSFLFVCFGECVEEECSHYASTDQTNTNCTLARYMITLDMQVRFSPKKWLYWLKTWLSLVVYTSLWLTLVRFAPSKLLIQYGAKAVLIYKV